MHKVRRVRAVTGIEVGGKRALNPVMRFTEKHFKDTEEEPSKSCLQRLEFPLKQTALAKLMELSVIMVETENVMFSGN